MKAGSHSGLSCAALFLLLALALAACTAQPRSGHGPGFDLSLAQDTVALARGGSMEVSLDVARRGGFDGAVTIRVTAHPPGIHAAEATTRGDSVQLALRADDDARGGVVTIQGSSPEAPEVPSVRLSFELQIGAQGASRKLKLVEVAGGLTIPWDLEFAPDGSLYFTERPGRVGKLLPGGEVLEIPFQNPPAFYVESEAGLMGMALDPGFPGTPYVYLCYSFLDAASAPRTQIARFTLAAGKLTSHKLLLLFPSAGTHNGCRLAFGPQGKLFGTIGDLGVSENAQDLGLLAGKIVRIGADGSVPADNPFIGQEGARPQIWTYGHRNPQGLAVDPASGLLYSTEHGEDTDDELNLIEAGKNYGWPAVRGTEDGEDYTPALASYYPCPKEVPAGQTCDPYSTIAIAGMTFYQGAMFPDWQGDILFVSLKTGRLYHVTLSPDGRAVTEDQIILDYRDQDYPAAPLLSHDYGRLRAIAVSPKDGAVYVTTSNGSGKDFILRLGLE